MLIHRKAPLFRPLLTDKRPLSTQLIKLVLRFLLVLLITSATVYVKISYPFLWRNANYLLLTSSTVLSAYIGGFTGGMVSNILGLFAINYYFRPFGTMHLNQFTILQTTIVIAQGALLSLLISLLRKNTIEEFTLRRWFEITLSSIGDAVMATNEKGQVMFMNQAAQKLTGWTSDKALGRPLSHIFLIQDGKTKRRLPSPFANVIKEKKALESGEDSILYTRDGRRYTIESLASPIEDYDKSIGGIILTFRDVTAKREHEKMMRKADAQIKEIFESITDAFFSLDTLWRITYINKKAQAIIGKSINGLLDYNFWDLFPEARGSVFQNKLERVLKNKRQSRFEFFYAGRNKWFNVSAYPMKKGIAVYFSDITKRKITEIELKKQQAQILQKERQFQAIIDGTPDVVIVKDVVGKYIAVNNTFTKLMGVSKEQVKGKSDYDFFPKAQADAYRKNDRRIIITGELQQIEEEVLMKDGTHVYLASKFPLYDAKGAIYATCGISTDITQRKMIEQKKDEFMSVASHELKTPLTSIKAYVQILERLISKTEDGMAKTVVAKTNIYINKLQSLITEFLDITRIQAGKLAIQRDTFSLREFITQSVEGVQLISPKHKIEIKGKINGMLTGDRQRLEQVMVNFLTNAVKYSPSADKIIVKVTKADGEVHISVTDFGIGIAPEKQQKLFTRFYRVDDTVKHFPGLGIGLYIAGEIVKRHGGRVWVASSPQKGSVFSFSLPTGKVNINHS